MSTRREQIEAMLRDEPDSVMLLYMLAMELRKEGDTDNALARFQQLIAGQAPHVPSYFMAAQMLAEEDRIEESRTLLREGIEEARRQGDDHAAGEMGDLLSSLGSL